MAGYRVKVHRGDRRLTFKPHASEMALEGIDVWDAELHNNSTHGELYKQVDKMLLKFNLNPGENN